MTEKEIRLELEKWRGYSAYEVAKKNGFNGTEKEWLEELGAATNITVNERQVDDEGNITLTAEHITMVDEGQITVKQKIESIEEELEETAQSAQAYASTKARVLTQTVTLPAASWEADEDIYGQSVSVTGVTANTSETSVIVTPTTNREMEEVYTDCEVRASAQGNGVVVFTCTDAPDVDLQANVMVVILGTEATNTESEASEE